MSEINPTPALMLPILIEHFGEAFCRAKTFPPLKIEMLGRTWSKLESGLIRRIEKTLPNVEPIDWVTGGFRGNVEQSRIEVEIPPPRNSVTWQSPLSVSFEAFRWRMRENVDCILVPAVNVSVVGRQSQLTLEVVVEQIHNAIARTLDRQDLREWFESFQSRTFSIKQINLPIPKLVREKESGAKEAKRRHRQTETLRSIAVNLSTGMFGSTIFCRDSEADKLAESVLRSNPRSVLIVGPAGVGKTALVHRLAFLNRQEGGSEGVALPNRASDNLMHLRHSTMPGHERTIWSTSGARIVSGMSGVGMWQQRALRLMHEVQQTRGILHLGSLMELIEAGKIQDQPGVASIMRQAISSGRIIAVAEATPQQLARIERDDPLLMRAFHRMELSEPTKTETLEILRQSSRRVNVQRPMVKPIAKTARKAKSVYKAKLERNVQKQSTQLLEPTTSVSEAAIAELVELFSRFATYSALPGPALRMLRSLQDEASDDKEIQAQDVTAAFALQTGLPRFLLDDSVTIDLEAIRTQLSSQVIGQSEPVDGIVNLIATFKARLARPGRPLASLLFIGPTGVGKTEMAKALAKVLYNDSQRMIRIDMSEYSNPWSAIRLIGRPGEGDGTLVSPIREQPFSVVLLDEFEKADPAVFDLLLQLLGEGRLTDSIGRLADFRNAVVIMTSNLGVESFRADGFGFTESGSGGWRAHFERELQRFVRPELLGRIDRIVPFTPLSREVVKQIVRRDLQALKNRWGLKSHDVPIITDEDAITRLAEIGYQPKYGARPIRRAIEEHVVMPLAAQLQRNWPRRVRRVHVLAQAEHVVVQLDSNGVPESQADQQRFESLDLWRELRHKAQLVRTCSEMRHLENTLELFRRRHQQLARRIRKTSEPNQIEALRRDIQKLSRNQHELTHRRDRLVLLIDRITHAQHALMMQWLRNEALDMPAAAKEFVASQEELRDGLLELLGEQQSRRKVLTIVLLCNPLERARLLWQTYLTLAEEMDWEVAAYWLGRYDPMLDVDSQEFHQRKSRGKVIDENELQKIQPSLRLRQSNIDDTSQPYTVDAYRVDWNVMLNELRTNLVGVAITLKGDGVGSWLSNEEGVHHFVADVRTEQSKRTRCRVVIQSQPLGYFALPNDWSETPSLPQRDPRRLYHAEHQTIVDYESSMTMRWEKGKEVATLLQMLALERDAVLWRSIGYKRIPRHARLSSAVMDGPFSEDAPF